MDLNDGIRRAEEILSIFKSDLTPEKKLRKVYPDLDKISQDHASASDRDKIIQWKEKLLKSGLLDLKEKESASGRLLGKQNNLTREIQNIIHSLINNNQKEIEKQS